MITIEKGVPLPSTRTLTENGVKGVRVWRIA